MTSYQIFNYRNYNLADIAYQKPTKSRGNSYNCLLNNEYDVLFQTKDIILKTGVVQTEREAHIDLDVSGTDLEDFIKRLDETNINYIFKNCIDWFDNELPFDAIKEFYISNIQDGILRLSIPLVRKKIDIRVYDNKKNIISSDDLTPGSKVVLVFRINGLKFLKKECLMDLDVVQIMLMKSSDRNNISTAKSVSIQKDEPQKKQSNEVLSRIQFRDNLKKKKEIARLAFEEAEQAQLKADGLKETASKLAKELKEMEDEYYKEEEEVYEEEEDDDDN